MSTRRKRVLFSLYDREGAVRFARELSSLHWEIIATQETLKLLKKEDIPVTSIYDFLDFREKFPFPPTLHPTLELALTTDKGKTIDFVYITPYPLSVGNDVGGHTILALACKGGRIAVFDKQDMEKVIHQLRCKKSEIPMSLRSALICKAHNAIVDHYQALASREEYEKKTTIISGEQCRELREGENPYQVPAEWLATEEADDLALSNFKYASERTACFTAVADFDCILHNICLLAETFTAYYKRIPFIAVAAKHGNACGLAVDWHSPGIVIEKALLGDPRAIFGGEVITNFHITEGLAGVLIESDKRKKILGDSKWKLDMIIAPAFRRGALKVLKKRKNLVLFFNKRLEHPHLRKLAASQKPATFYRFIRGGILRQPTHHYILDLNSYDIKQIMDARPEEFDSLIIAWTAAWTSFHGGNEVALAGERMLLSAAGGPATINSCQTAVARARQCRHRLQRSVFAADAFFPFTDAPNVLVKAGCKLGVVPAGGKNFRLVKRYFEKQDVKVFYLPEQIRGFFRH